MSDYSIEEHLKDAAVSNDQRFTETLSLSVKILATLTAGAIGILIPLILSHDNTTIVEHRTVLKAALQSYVCVLGINFITIIASVVARLLESIGLLIASKAYYRKEEQKKAKMILMAKVIKIFPYIITLIQLIGFLKFFLTSYNLAHGI